MILLFQIFIRIIQTRIFLILLSHIPHIHYVKLGFGICRIFHFLLWILNLIRKAWKVAFSFILNYILCLSSCYIWCSLSVVWVWFAQTLRGHKWCINRRSVAGWLVKGSLVVSWLWLFINIIKNPLQISQIFLINLIRISIRNLPWSAFKFYIRLAHVLINDGFHFAGINLLF